MDILLDNFEIISYKFKKLVEKNEELLNSKINDNNKFGDHNNNLSSYNNIKRESNIYNENKNEININFNNNTNNTYIIKHTENLSVISLKDQICNVNNTELLNKISILESKNIQLVDKVTKLEKEIETNVKLRVSKVLNEQNFKLSEDIITANLKINQLLEQNDNYSKSNNSLTLEIKRITSLLLELKSKFKTKEKEISQLKKNMISLNDERKKFEAESNNIISSLNEITRKEINDLNLENDNLYEDIRKLSVLYQETQTQNKDSKDSIEDNKFSKFNNELNNLITINERNISDISEINLLVEDNNKLVCKQNENFDDIVDILNNFNKLNKLNKLNKYNDYFNIIIYAADKF